MIEIRPTKEGVCLEWPADEQPNERMHALKLARSIHSGVILQGARMLCVLCVLCMHISFTGI